MSSSKTDQPDRPAPSPSTGGATNLHYLLSNLRPQLDPELYVYLSLPHPADELQFNALARISEDEGITLIVSKAQADRAGHLYTATFRRITLKVPSSLFAVGLTAAFSTALSDANLSCNVVAAFHHDHIFVEEQSSTKAIRVLEQLQLRTTAS